MYKLKWIIKKNRITSYSPTILLNSLSRAIIALDKKFRRRIFIWCLVTLGVGGGGGGGLSSLIKESKLSVNMSLLGD